MKITITKNCYVDGKARKIGDAVETEHGQMLIGCGKAVVYVEQPKQENKPKKAPTNRKAVPDATR